MPSELGKTYKILLIVLFAMTLNIEYAKTQIVYVDIDPDTTIFVPSIGGTHNIYDFDIDNNNIIDFNISASYFYVYGGPTTVLGREIVFKSLFTENMMTGTCGTWGYYYPVLIDDTISVNSNWFNYNNYIVFNCSGIPMNCEAPVEDFYLGFKFLIGSNFFYAWARVSATYNSITIKDYAYNSIPNMYILAEQKEIDFEYLPAEVNIFENKSRLIVVNNTPFLSGNIRIYNTLGRLVKVFNLTDIYNIIPLTGINSGIYIIRVETDDRVVNKKMFIQAH